MANADLKQIASTLAGSKVSEVVPVGRGGNSRVYMVATAEKLYALKEYPVFANDPRDRLQAERQALELMHAHGIHSVPRWHAATSPYALMDWIDGFVIAEPRSSDIDDAAVFLGTLHHISQKTPAEAMPMASEACISGQAIIDQLEHRVAALMPYTKENPPLMKFLSQQFLPVFTRRFMAAKKAYPNFVEPLPQSARSLIPADFGFHNMMRALSGQLYFIDFEYFGWDDPVKLMCDFLLHPATNVPDAMRTQFYDYALTIYGEAVRERFTLYYPLFGLRWALIMLNDFLPDRWNAKQKTGAAADWAEVKETQLAKAEAMVNMSEKFQ